jgi:ankyrin repeat protein
VELAWLPFDSPLNRYEKQAEELLAAHGAGETTAIQIIHHCHPRFLDEKIRWLPKDLADDEIRAAAFDLEDARLTVARGYNFLDWEALAEYVHAVGERASPVFRFESAVEAVVTGDLAALQALLSANPELVRSRSTRRTHFDPPVHRATLLHYIAANGVENYRQKTPKNAVAIAKALLDAGADVDALASLYGTECTTMALLVSSSHPAEAGVQVDLVHTLLDYGAAIDGCPPNKWGTPLMTALVFGFPNVAHGLAERGARIDTIAAAAGLGSYADVQRLMSDSSAEDRHRALALAAQLGHADVVRLLLESGEDPNRCNPENFHAHATPLHQAVIAGHEPVVRLLVERGARLDIKDKIYKSTPLGWAIHAGKKEIEAYLRAHGAV